MCETRSVVFVKKLMGEFFSETYASDQRERDRKHISSCKCYLVGIQSMVDALKLHASNLSHIVLILQPLSQTIHYLFC